MRNMAGFGIIDMMVSLCMVGVLSAMVTTNLKPLDNPLQDTSAEIASFFKQARAKSMSTTSAYRIYPVSATEIHTEVAKNCTDTDTEEDVFLRMDTPTGVILTDTSWSVCFNSRGLPDGNVLVYLQDKDLNVRGVELLLGGAVRVDT